MDQAWNCRWRSRREINSRAFIDLSAASDKELLIFPQCLVGEMKRVPRQNPLQRLPKMKDRLSESSNQKSLLLNKQKIKNHEHGWEFNRLLSAVYSSAMCNEEGCDSPLFLWMVKWEGHETISPWLPAHPSESLPSAFFVPRLWAKPSASEIGFLEQNNPWLMNPSISCFINNPDRLNRWKA